jgi:hypothetical protein
MIEIENQINTIKEIVDNAMHVMIDEDEIFSFSKTYKKEIENQNLKQQTDLDKIIQNLLNLNILKSNNTQAKTELEASAKLSIHLIKQENNCETENILKYLTNLK